jgi:hypothetical protein
LGALRLQHCHFDPGQGASPGPHVDILRCFLGFGCACSLQGGAFDDVPQGAGCRDDWISTTAPSRTIAGTAMLAAWLIGTPKPPALPVAMPIATPALTSARRLCRPNRICTLRTLPEVDFTPAMPLGLDGPGR